MLLAFLAGAVLGPVAHNLHHDFEHTHGPAIPKHHHEDPLEGDEHTQTADGAHENDHDHPWPVDPDHGEESLQHFALALMPAPPPLPLPVPQPAVLAPLFLRVVARGQEEPRCARPRGPPTPALPA